MPNTTKWYYRFGNEEPEMGLIFSGSINTASAASESDARDAIRTKHHYNRLPAHTIVVSAFDYARSGICQ